MNFINKKYLFAVIGASTNHDKWGWKVFNSLINEDFKVVPINPNYKVIDRFTCYPNLKSVPVKPDVVITVVPPEVTLKILMECKELGINKVWMQPGSESSEAVKFCDSNGIKVIYNACFIVNGLKRFLD